MDNKEKLEHYSGLYFKIIEPPFKDDISKTYKTFSSQSQSDEKRNSDEK